MCRDMTPLPRAIKRAPAQAEAPVGTIREDIVEAAAELFATRGYHAASMQDLAEVTGMRKASLYHHVRKKEDLLFAIHDRLITELIEHTREVCESDDDPAHQLRRILRVTMDMIANRHQDVRVFLHEANTLEGDRWLQIVAKRDEYEHMVAGVLRAGVRDGSFVKIKIEIATKGILAMANWGYTWFRRGGAMSSDEVADLFADIALRGIEPR
jgi:TetR/AcrR family transcriptional regulator, cholesterol catabolism regulator